MVGDLRACIDYLLSKDPGGMFEVKAYKPQRSESQNKYFHRLSDMIADARTKRGDAISKAAEKNELLAKYGQRMRDADGTPIGIKTNMRPEKMRELERPHTAFKEETEDGAYKYYWLVNSSELTTDEMSALIDGTIEDAKEWGVETWPEWKLKEVRERERNRNV